MKKYKIAFTVYQNINTITWKTDSCYRALGIETFSPFHIIEAEDEFDAQEILLDRFAHESDLINGLVNAYVEEIK